MREDVVKLDMDGIASPQVGYWSADVIVGVTTHDLVVRIQEVLGLLLQVRLKLAHSQTSDSRTCRAIGTVKQGRLWPDFSLDYKPRGPGKIRVADKIVDNPKATLESLFRSIIADYSTCGYGHPAQSSTPNCFHPYHQHKTLSPPSNDASRQTKTRTATNQVYEAKEAKAEGCRRRARAPECVRTLNSQALQQLNACCRVVWDHELCEKMLSIIIEDDKLHNGLFPGPGTTQEDGTGSNKQPKSEFEWMIATRLFGNGQYADLFAQSTTTPAGRTQWTMKIKNRLTQ
jgi:hypothetical protein